MKVEIIESSDVEKKALYVVVISKYRDKFIFVKHSERDTVEIPGGKIEEGESVYEAAERELVEETGAKEFLIKKMFSYKVIKDSDYDYGVVFFAEISKLSGVLEFEIEELYFLDEFPANSTYPVIQNKIFSHFISLKNLRIMSSKTQSSKQSL